jgi:8-oxo-dGTP pyrophosphatase MutT (NUDIX family)
MSPYPPKGANGVPDSNPGTDPHVGVSSDEDQDGGPPLREALEDFEAAGATEIRDLARIRRLAQTADPWGRGGPFHVTSSALVVHAPTRRVLLRWHDRLGRWLHVGGHAEPGENRPFAVARREAMEETSLEDLTAWPDPDRSRLIQVVTVSVPATPTEAAHDHADVRYLLATAQPQRAAAERPTAPLRWLSIDDALDLVGEDNVAVAIRRLAVLLEDR